MIGQMKLKKHLSNLVTKPSRILPNFIVLQGPVGSGKRTLIREELTKLLDARLYIPQDLKVDSVRDVIQNSLTNGKNCVYLFADIHEMSLATQNTLLKITEEPSRNTYIVATTTHIGALLPTLQSRATTFMMDCYTSNELKDFTKDPVLLEISCTPGEILRLQQLPWKEILELCNKIVQDIEKASAPNVLNITKRVKTLVGPENYDLLFSLLAYSYSTYMSFQFTTLLTVTTTNWKPVHRSMQILYHYRQLLKNKSLNKENLLDILFLELREVSL